MAQRKVSNSKIGVFVVGAALAYGVSGIPASFAEPVTPTQVRLEHARELLGSHYQKTLKAADNTREVRDFVKQVTKGSLSAKWKRSAPKIARAILQESKRYGFDPIFLVSVIQTESGFSPTALGSAGEIGLMQLRPQTAKWIAHEFDFRWRGKKTLRDPVANIRLGAAYLSLLREKFGKDGRLYIPAYNMGPTAVKTAVSDEVIPVDYARRVMGKYLKNYARISMEIQEQNQERNQRLLHQALRRERQRVRELERGLSAQRARQVAEK